MVQLSHPYMTTGKTIALTILYCTILTAKCPGSIPGWRTKNQLAVRLNQRKKKNKLAW